MENGKINRVLREILDEKRREVSLRKRRGLFYKPYFKREPINVLAYLKSRNFTVIAEVKRASPLKDEFRPGFDPVVLAKTYTKAGAGMISVITEEPYFKGSLEYLLAIREVTSLPILRKDFIIDPIQIEEARAFGADTVLLIATILDEETLKGLISYAKKLGLFALVEVHDEEDLEKALSCNAEIIGINNRNLKTLEVSVENSVKLKKLIPPSIPVIAESGYNSCEQVKELVAHGFKGVLIGTHFVKSENPEVEVRKFVEASYEA
ncbi:MAG: indole-3-glycerol phosphate synthase TrpC [Thermodesulfobacteria bacterium]|nr:indole-3-glycerol phosphate synthase TrpC [Thermodesulfobacteriota bacterium]